MGSLLSRPGSGTTTIQNDATAVNSSKNHQSSTSTNLNLASGSGTNDELASKFSMKAGPGNAVSSPGNALAKSALASVVEKDMGPAAMENALNHLFPALPSS